MQFFNIVNMLIRFKTSIAQSMFHGHSNVVYQNLS